MTCRLLPCHPVWLILLTLTGCASGGKVTFFHEANRLDDNAKLLRDVSEAPADVGRELDKRPDEEYRVEPGDVMLVQAIELASPLRLPGDQRLDQRIAADAGPAPGHVRSLCRDAGRHSRIRPCCNASNTASPRVLTSSLR